MSEAGGLKLAFFRVCIILAGMRLVATFLALLAVAPAAAQAPPRAVPSLPGLGTADPRLSADTRQAPWRALGRVQTELGGRCTGVLVGAEPRADGGALPGRAAQPGHLVQPGTRAFPARLRPRRVHGPWRGSPASPVGPGLRRRRGGPAGADWAVLTLDRCRSARRTRVLPLLRDVPPPRTPLMLGGYQQDRPEVLLADTACRAARPVRDPAGRGDARCMTAPARAAPAARRCWRAGRRARWGVTGVAVARVSPGFTLGYAVPAAAIAHGAAS